MFQEIQCLSCCKFYELTYITITNNDMEMCEKNNINHMKSIYLSSVLIYYRQYGHNREKLDSRCFCQREDTDLGGGGGKAEEDGGEAGIQCPCM